jgi:hypothetical protein
VVGDAVDMVFMRHANAALGGQQQIPMKILYNCLYFAIDGWNVCAGMCACMKFIRAIYKRLRWRIVIYGVFLAWKSATPTICAMHMAI